MKNEFVKLVKFVGKLFVTKKITGRYKTIKLRSTQRARGRDCSGTRAMDERLEWEDGGDLGSPTYRPDGKREAMA